MLGQDLATLLVLAVAVFLFGIEHVGRFCLFLTPVLIADPLRSLPSRHSRHAMFDAFWHLRGSLRLAGAAADDATLDRIQHFLERQCKAVNERSAHHVAFDDPLWRNFAKPNWLALVIFDRGTFWIERDRDERRLRYQLRSLHALIFCLFAAVLCCFFGLAAGSATAGLNYAALAFAWLYGMNMLTALVRVPSAIRKALKEG